mgnify:CR=1 FL=1
MRNQYTNEFGSVWVIDDLYVLEKYYRDLEGLFNDETLVFEEITEMDFFVLKRTIYSKENNQYVLMHDLEGLYEPNGPEWIWVLKYDLEYLGE